MKTLATLLRISSLAFLFTVLFWAYSTTAQTETGTVSGLITDESGAAVPGAQVQLLNVQRGTTSDTKTNNAGLYIFSGVEAGQYQVKVQKTGFKQVDLLSLIVNVQDHIEQNVRLQLGSVSESITVNAEESHINTTDATVSTVVDRNFADNLPLNGRSFQTLLNMTPGVVPLRGGNGNGSDSGQFSVNGQRGTSNYWMVDGVSANADAGGSLGNQITGATGVLSVLGGTNSLVPVDDMEEFRIQTSTFAPEFGRTPGAQISILTRSGKNVFHGSAFEYFRNDVLDANDWFNGVHTIIGNLTPKPKAEERQNQFGGTFGGPIIKNRTFFFFSYEGLRLRLPTTTLTTVPDLAARQSAAPVIQPVLNAFPFDPNQPDLGNGIAQFNASYSNPGTVNDYNLRIDHRIGDKFNLFARYNYSPSTLATRGQGLLALSSVSRSRNVAQQLTGGLTWSASPRAINEFRINYSRADASSSNFLDSFGGAVPWVPVAPDPFSAANSNFEALILSLSHFAIESGPSARSIQHQFNLLDSETVQWGSHSVKAGVDYRRLSPVILNPPYEQTGLFLSVPQAESGTSLFTVLGSQADTHLLFRNLSVFVQDTWHLVPRLTLTYGLRWDTDFAPTSTSGTPMAALANFNASDLSSVTLAPLGTPPFHTDFGNVAPRIGLAYQLFSTPNWGTVMRGGFGVFYDLATSETANAIGEGGFPFRNSVNLFGSAFPLTGAAAAPPAITTPTPSTPGFAAGLDPNLKSPYTLQWNIALEQGLGAAQSLTVSYLGAAGRRLLQTGIVIPQAPGQLNPAFSQLIFASNSGSSDYDALQVKFERRLARNLQILSSYSWAHSIDTSSAGSATVQSDRTGPGAGPTRASSDFDIRQTFTLGSTYSLPAISNNSALRHVTRGWSWQNIVQARTAPPVTVFDGAFINLSTPFSFQIRPDVLPGVPLYLFGSQYPGGKRINNTPGAGLCPDGSPSVGPFCAPPINANGVLIRQGNLGRNALRGFGSFQWDMGIHREFPLHESLKLEFRCEMFNVLNHPNFGPPASDISNPSALGLSQQSLNNYLGGGFGGGLNSIYQIGGPRSVQLALRLSF
jgi:hypothetical protein